MRVFIAGGTGFVGRFLVNSYLKDKNNKVTIIGRSFEKIHKVFSNSVEALSWLDITNGKKMPLQQADLVINLSGANLSSRRWNKRYKRTIIKSRVIPTSILADSCAKLKDFSPPLFNASAVGIYKEKSLREDKSFLAFDENSAVSFKDSFLSEVTSKWESSAKIAIDAGVRVIFMRFGIVIGRGGGVLEKMKRPYKLFLGGKIGSGNWPISWICLPDIYEAINFLFKTDIKGAVNFVAPECITQNHLAKSIGEILNKPSFFTTPKFLLRLIFGQMADELLLSGQKVTPKILLKNNFEFKYPNINSALKYAL